MMSNRDRLAGSLLEADRPDEWRTRGACHGLWELFDVDIGDHAAKAKRVCAGCPVRAECLDEAMAEEGGTWRANRACVRGGLTSHERYELWRCLNGQCRHERGRCRGLAS